MSRRKKFGEILVEAKVVDVRQIESALFKQKGTGRRLGQILEEMGVITERDIAAVLARQFGLKTVANIAKASFSQELLDLCDGGTAMTKLVFPLKKEGKTLYLAMVNPLDVETIDDFAYKKGLRVISCITTPAEIHAAVGRHYFNIYESTYTPVFADEVIERDYEETAARTPEPHRNGEDLWTADDLWTVLVIDGEDRDRSEIVAVLKREGYALLEASNCAEGLKVALQKKPHLIIADIVKKQTGMDGKDMVRAIKGNVNLQHTPLVAISTTSTAEEEAVLLEMGCFDFMTKPLNPVRLVARSKHALRIVYGSNQPPR
ncbi:MAG: response regulator [Desulfuromonadales bacterium]